jgi:hypothetical protein
VQPASSCPPWRRTGQALRRFTTRTAGRTTPPCTPAPAGHREVSPDGRVHRAPRFHDLRHFYTSTMIAANLNPQGDPGTAWARDNRRDDGRLRALVPDSEDLGRAAVDDALAGALAKHERNSTAW